MYDFLIVGAGVYGATVARILADGGKRVLVIDKRAHIGGNCYTAMENGIYVHKYGAHIFHTNDEKVWDFVTRFAKFNDYVHTVTADYKGERYSLPFSMYTFEQMWGVRTAEEATAVIEAQKAASGIAEPSNLEEQAISMVGTDIYEKLVKGYTEKQWGMDCKDLPAFIIKRLPLRMTYDNGYFNAAHQGIPAEGYTAMVEQMLEGIDVRLGVDYLDSRDELDGLADKVIYTGQLDRLMDYQLGALEYRAVGFENELVDVADYQGCSVVNYTDRETPWTRIIEHKWFCPETAKDIPQTIISREYSRSWVKGDEPFYPVNNDRNNELYEKYRELAESSGRYIVGGRLGDYKYYDMDVAIGKAIELAKSILDEVYYR